MFIDAERNVAALLTVRREMSTEKGPNNETHMALLTLTEDDNAGNSLSINIALLRRADRMVLTVLVEVIIELRMIFLISLIKQLLPFIIFGSQAF